MILFTIKLSLVIGILMERRIELTRLAPTASREERFMYFSIRKRTTVSCSLSYPNTQGGVHGILFYVLTHPCQLSLVYTLFAYVPSSFHSAKSANVYANPWVILTKP